MWWRIDNLERRNPLRGVSALAEPRRKGTEPVRLGGGCLMERRRLFEKKDIESAFPLRQDFELIARWQREEESVRLLITPSLELNISSRNDSPYVEILKM